MADHKACLYEKYVWEVPVRVTHWVNMLSIVVLSLTGIFIGSPRTLGLSASDYVMGWARFVHFTAAYTLTVSVAARIWWMFRGNRYARWREFVPIISRDGRRRLWETLKYYTFLNRKAPHEVGHNAVAATAYSLVFLLYLVMIVTGFALYAEHRPGGLMHVVLAPMYALFSNQGMRLTHHLVMWLLIGFVINHVYSIWLMDIKERGGVVSSIFGGYKAVQRKE